MACAAPFDAFRLATEHLNDDLYLRASYRDIWLNLIPRSDYESGTGIIQSTFTIGRSEPTADVETWSPVTLTTEGTYTGSCNVTYNDVNYGMVENTYGPESYGLRGPIICQDDLIYNFKAERFLEFYLQALAKRSGRSVSNRLLYRYIQLTYKSVARADYQLYNPTDALPPAQGELTQEMLDSTAVELNEAGASDPNTNGWINLGQSGPLYPIYIGQEASQQISLNNAEFRQDYRFAFEGKGDVNPLLRRLGAEVIIKNFRHVINLFPPRYEYQGGVYIRVNTWLMSNGTKGKVAVINPAWRTATYEAAIVLSPWVMHEELVKPVNAAAGLNWMPKSYFGEWQFVTGGREISDDPACYDPQKKYGRHFAEYKHALRPIFPEFGRAIFFKRCVTNNFAVVGCS